MERIMYHTQEERIKKLDSPVACIRDDAWLGIGYYFWEDFDDAKKWGRKSKKETGRYEIYKASIFCENILDTVFNEEHYRFWLAQIEKIANRFKITDCRKPTLKEVNIYIKNVAKVEEVKGIIFQDFSTNLKENLVQPIELKDRKIPFVYKKRIQAVLYNLDIINTFDLFFSDNCTKKDRNHGT